MQEKAPRRKPRAESVSFVIPVPLSKKNNMRRKRIGRHVREVPSDEVVAQEEQIALAALQAMRAAGLELESLDDFAVEITYGFASGAVRVTCTRIGPPVKVGRSTGRRRDLQNLGDSILDAMEGVVFRNDNQVAALKFKRVPFIEWSTT